MLNNSCNKHSNTNNNSNAESSNNNPHIIPIYVCMTRQTGIVRPSAEMRCGQRDHAGIRDWCADLCAVCLRYPGRQASKDFDWDAQGP